MCAFIAGASSAASSAATSATPLGSISTRSGAQRADHLHDLPRRSPRSEQQMQPFGSSTTSAPCAASSDAVDADRGEIVDQHHRAPAVVVRSISTRRRYVVLPAPRKPATTSTSKGRGGLARRAGPNARARQPAAAAPATSARGSPAPSGWRGTCSRPRRTRLAPGARRAGTPARRSPSRSSPRPGTAGSSASWSGSPSGTPDARGRNSSLQVPHAEEHVQLGALVHPPQHHEGPHARPGWLVPHVSEITAAADAMIASSCYRLVWIAWPKCAQPRAAFGAGAGRGPVTNAHVEGDLLPAPGEQAAGERQVGRGHRGVVAWSPAGRRTRRRGPLSRRACSI